jgi:hypothetical protein
MGKRALKNNGYEGVNNATVGSKCIMTLPWRESPGVYL